MKRKIAIITFIFFFSCASNENFADVGIGNMAEEEFNAVFVSTIYNLDWPSRSNLNREQQIAEIEKILDISTEMNIKNIILQVRDAGEVIYYSIYEPWSFFLSGEQGVSMGYDPLQIWIEEGKKRGIKIHAWINPYRVGVPGILKYNKKSPKNKPFVKNLGKGYYWMDPGNQKSTEYIKGIVTELLKNYDIAGIHFDDYFYPYSEYGKINDLQEYASYRNTGGTLNISSWRRENINNMIETVYRTIKGIKPDAVFGISPFGIWKSSEIKGVKGKSSYDEIYSDSLSWIRKGNLDYISPQIYWPYSNGLGPYGGYYKKILEWWNRENENKVALYPAVWISSPYIKKDIFKDIKEQIECTRSILGSSAGNIFFGFNLIYRNEQHIREKFINFYEKKMAFTE